jgi:hypothetical protein
MVSSLQIFSSTIGTTPSLVAPAFGRGRARGISAVAFIIAIVLFLGAAGAAYSFYTDLEEAKAARAEAEQRELTQKNRAQTAEFINDQVATVVGFASSSPGLVSVDTTAIKSARDQLVTDFADGDVNWGAGLSRDQTLQQLIENLATALRGKQDEIVALKSQIATKDQELADAAAKEQASISAAEERNTELQGQIRVVERERDENQRRADDEAKERRDEVNALTEQKEDERIRAVQQERALREDIALVEANLNKLKEKEEVRLERSDLMDGKIVAADVEHNLAMINLGKEDGLRLGTRFDVFRVIHGTVEQFMGVIEVRETGEDYAECSVVEVVDPTNPFVAEDSIRNAIYDPERTREFAFAGSVTNSRYSIQEIAAMIESFGGRLVDEVDVTTDVIVLGAGYEDDANFTKAQDLRLEAMREQELLRQLGR